MKSKDTFFKLKSLYNGGIQLSYYFAYFYIILAPEFGIFISDNGGGSSKMYYYFCGPLPTSA